MLKRFLFRVSAACFDLITGFILCYILHWWVGHYFATRAVVTFHIGSPDSVWKGLIPWFLGLFGTYFYTLPLAFSLVFLPEAIWGKSIGKAMFQLKVVNQDGSMVLQKTLWRRFFLKTILFWGLALALVFGSWQLILLAVAIGVMSLIFDFHDRLAGTKVVIET